MIRTLLLACAALLVAACSSREPSNAELAQLLQREGGSGIDMAAVECLRAWSGDGELRQGLPETLGDDAGRDACRQPVEGWLADQGRNPAGYGFKNLVRPPVVRRAAALAAADAANAARTARPEPASRPAPSPSMGTPPPALREAASPRRGMVEVRGGPVGGMGSAGEDLLKAEDVCTRLQALAQGQPRDSALYRYANYCGRTLNRARRNLRAAADRGIDKSLEAGGEDVRNLATVGERLLQEHGG